MIHNPLRTVELFCGIGGFRQAADRLGIETVFANDCCPDANSVYHSRFGTDLLTTGIIQDHLEEIPAHDILTAGFPCQPFSAAGKKQGTRDSRGTLFEVIATVLANCNPQVFVLENVKRLLTMEKGQHFATILDTLSSLGYVVEWRLKNAYEFGLPQNRQRIVITGRRDQSAQSMQARLIGRNELQRASAAPEANRNFWTPIAKHGKSFPNWGLSVDGKFTGVNIPTSSPESGLSLKLILQDDYDQAVDMTHSTIERLEQNDEVNRYVQFVQILSNQGGGARMGYTIFGIEGLAPTLTASTSRHYERYKVGDVYRRLTCIEYARLQGFADDHCSAVSPYTQYRLFGNALPPQLANWAMSQAIAQEGVELGEHHQRQLALEYA